MSSSVVQEMSTSSRSALTDGWMDLSMSEIEKKKKNLTSGVLGHTATRSKLKHEWAS